MHFNFAGILYIRKREDKLILTILKLIINSNALTDFKFRLLK